MSEYVFKLPDLGEGTVESEIAEWFVKVGDDVSEEDVVGTMMTDKAAVELSSPVTGKVVRLAGDPGDVIAVGAPLVVFETNSGGNGRDQSAAVPVAEDAEQPVAASESQVDVSSEESDEPVAGKVITSPAIRRRAKEAGIDLNRVPGSGANGRILRKDLDAYLHQQLPESGQPTAIAKTAQPR